MLFKTDGSCLNNGVQHVDEETPHCGICDCRFECLDGDPDGDGADSKACRVLLKSAHDYFQKPTCPHVFCKSCLSGWIKVKLAEYKPDIRCPERGCRCALYADDVKRLTDAKTLAMFVKLRSMEHHARLVEVLRAGDTKVRLQPPALVLLRAQHVFTTL